MFHTIKERCGVFLRANIEGEVWLIVLEWDFKEGIWLIVPDYFFKFSRRDMVVCQM